MPLVLISVFREVGGDRTKPGRLAVWLDKSDRRKNQAGP